VAVSVWSHSPRQVHSDSEYLESLTTGQWLRTHLRPLDYEFSSAVPPDQLKVRLSAELATSYHPVRLAHSLIVDDRTLFGEISGDRVTFRLYRGDASLSVGSWLRPRLWGTISATDEGGSLLSVSSHTPLWFVGPTIGLLLLLAVGVMTIGAGLLVASHTHGRLLMGRNLLLEALAYGTITGGIFWAAARSGRENEIEIVRTLATLDEEVRP
jgi:hypothetical protein